MENLYLINLDDGRECCKRIVDSRVGNQIGLEFSQVHIEGSIKPEGCSDRGNYLGNESVQVGVCRLCDVEVCPA